MRKVIDSSRLQSNELHKYLSSHQSNYAVLPDYVAMEAYKVGSVDRILERMQVVSQFPRQILVLKDTAKVCGLRGLRRGLQARLIDHKQTAGFGAYCTGLERARKGDVRYLRALEAHARAAQGQVDKLLAGVTDLVDSRRDIVNSYTEAELRTIRKRTNPPESLKTKFVRNVQMLCAVMLRNHPSVTTVPSDFDVACNLYIFRVALCAHVWMLDWAADGCMEGSHTRVRNDVIDLSVAAYATYFDGLMTGDERLSRIHAIARGVLDTILSGPPQSAGK